MQQPKAKVKNIEFLATYRGSLVDKQKQMICCDESRIMQVLIGLQNNALKFTSTGKVETSVEIIELSDHEYLQISVKDTGVGIAAEDHHKLFKLFGFVNDQK